MKSKRREKTLNKGSVLNVVFFLAFITLVGGLSVVGSTFSYFSDIETSKDNMLTAGTLDFSLRSGQSNFISSDKTSDMKPGDNVSRDIYIKKEGSLPFKYTAVSEPGDDCDMELYDALYVEIWYNYYEEPPEDPDYHEHRNMVLKYEGPLKDFELDKNEIPNGNPYFENKFYEEDEHWLYATVILPEDIDSNLQNKSCEFKFVFDAWQTNFEEPIGGFTDTEEITSVLSTGDWMPEVQITYPVGEETWYLVPDSWANNSYLSSWCESKGMNENCEYGITWTAENKIGENSDLLINIYFSNDSGDTWFEEPIATSTENDGTYWWKPPYHEDYITEEGRIKIEAVHKDYSFLKGQDESEDFCPPMMTLEALFGLDDGNEDEKLTSDKNNSTEEIIGKEEDNNIGVDEDEDEDDDPEDDDPEDEDSSQDDETEEDDNEDDQSEEDNSEDDDSKSEDSSQDDETEEDNNEEDDSAEEDNNEESDNEDDQLEGNNDEDEDLSQDDETEEDNDEESDNEDNQTEEDDNDDLSQDDETEDDDPEDDDSSQDNGTEEENDEDSDNEDDQTEDNSAADDSAEEETESDNNSSEEETGKNDE